MKRNEKSSMPTLDKAASFIAVSVPLLWLSYMMAAKIYAASHLIPHEILLVSCFVLLGSLVLKCTSFLTVCRNSGGTLCKTSMESASKTGNEITAKYKIWLGDNPKKIKQTLVTFHFVDGVSESKTVNDMFSYMSRYVQAREQLNK